MANGSHPVISEQDDCTICHMPNRRTQDVIEVLMTDHRIVRTPPPGELLAPIAKLVPNVTGVSMLDPAHTLSGPEVTLYESMAVLKHTSGQADYATDALRAALDRLETTDQAPWLELAKSLTRQGKHDDAVKAANTALRLSPDHPGARATLGVALLGAGKPALGAAILKRLLDENPDLADAQYNYALSQRALGNMDAALASARRALHLRHTMWAAWRMIGEIDATQGRAETAAQAFQNALAIHPDAPRVRAGLIAVLDQLGQDEHAARHRTLLLR